MSEPLEQRYIYNDRGAPIGVAVTPSYDPKIFDILKEKVGKLIIERNQQYPGGRNSAAEARAMEAAAWAREQRRMEEEKEREEWRYKGRWSPQDYDTIREFYKPRCCLCQRPIWDMQIRENYIEGCLDVRMECHGRIQLHRIDQRVGFDLNKLLSLIQPFASDRLLLEAAEINDRAKKEAPKKEPVPACLPSIDRLIEVPK